MPKRFSRVTVLKDAVRASTKRINGLEFAVKSLDKQLHNTCDDLFDARAEIDAAKSIAGRFSLFAPPEPYNVGGYPRRVELPVQEPLDMSVASYMFKDSVLSQREPLHVVLSHVDEDRMKRMLHVKVEFADGVTGYALSQDAVRNMTYSELIYFLTKHVTPDIIRHIVQKVKR